MTQDTSLENPQKTANYDEIVADLVTKIDRPVVLIGMMGTGKSQLGRTLAKKLGLPFFDTDHEFEMAANMSIAEYFAQYGEEAFRAGEYRVLERLVDNTPKIVATGGGIISLAQARALLKDKAWVIWLEASPEVLAARCAGNNKRPLLQTGDPLEILNALLKKRETLYQEVTHIKASTERACGDEAMKQMLEGLKQCLTR